MSQQTNNWHFEYIPTIFLIRPTNADISEFLRTKAMAISLKIEDNSQLFEANLKCIVAALLLYSIQNNKQQILDEKLMGAFSIIKNIAKMSTIKNLMDGQKNPNFGDGLIHLLFNVNEDFKFNQTLSVDNTIKFVLSKLNICVRVWTSFSEYKQYPEVKETDAPEVTIDIFKKGLYKLYAFIPMDISIRLFNKMHKSEDSIVLKFPLYYCCNCWKIPESTCFIEHKNRICPSTETIKIQYDTSLQYYICEEKNSCQTDINKKVAKYGTSTDFNKKSSKGTSESTKDVCINRKSTNSEIALALNNEGLKKKQEDQTSQSKLKISQLEYNSIIESIRAFHFPACELNI